MKYYVLFDWNSTHGPSIYRDGGLYGTVEADRQEEAETRAMIAYGRYLRVTADPAEVAGLVRIEGAGVGAR